MSYNAFSESLFDMEDESDPIYARGFAAGAGRVWVRQSSLRQVAMTLLLFMPCMPHAFVWMAMGRYLRGFILPHDENLQLRLWPVRMLFACCQGNLTPMVFSRLIHPGVAGFQWEGEPLRRVS